MRIVTFLWTRYGTDDILVRNTEGVLRERLKHLDPDGCLVQQHEHRTYEDAAKAARDMKPIRQNRVWSIEATLLRTEVAGEVYFLDKDLFMGTTSNAPRRSKGRHAHFQEASRQSMRASTVRPASPQTTCLVTSPLAHSLPSGFGLSFFPLSRPSIASGKQSKRGI